MKQILKRIRNRISGKSQLDREMEYLVAHGLRVGENFSSYSDHPFDSNWPWLISVGNNVLLSSNVKILAHDASTCYSNSCTRIGLVSIGDDVFVGANSTILCNVKIGNNVIIGAGSVVSKNIPDNCVAAGNPAQVICTMEEYREKHAHSQERKKDFSKHKWDQWINAGPADWEEMRAELEKGPGYV